ncbi:ubiquitin carboxyl-terminal hydrolase isozyme L5-like [Eriocheir sinensis]|uniref:ubiquitin carboxyl-terminal hydrolase isozyme L5-like n=1 Tax=Eriocheir sinensis TaxID=95602 RepID=UPI0021C9CCE6|nr:ubiquitin carboxyl-terminal hydrolase isozyme L5-like [Eriocheir sinensis]
MVVSDAGNWCLIESDPGVFTDLILKFGVKGVQVEEIWSLDEDSFSTLKPVHGLIFLFKWQQEEQPSGSVVQDNRLDKIFFAKQMINNACATQAILSVLLNTKHSDIQLGSTLSEFREFTQTFDAHMKGLALSNSDTIRNVHNSFARQTLFEFDKQQPSEDEDVFHFVGYIPIEGRLYELDGLKDGPIDLGPIAPGTDWLSVVQPVIQRRIQKYSEGEIHFNLMAIVSDRKMVMEKKISQLQKEIEESGMDSSSQEEELTQLRAALETEENKRARWRIENIRRKHNYLPLIVNMMKILAEEGKLLPIYHTAREKAKARHEKAKEKNKEKSGV